METMSTDNRARPMTSQAAPSDAGGIEPSFGFLDLCGFTAYTHERGNRDAVALVALLRSALRKAAEDYGVRVMWRPASNQRPSTGPY